MKKPWWWHLNPWLACARTGRAYIVALDEMRDLVIRNANLELEVKRLRKDAERLDAVASEMWKLDPFDAGDDDVGWRVVQYHMGKPRERTVAEVFTDDPRVAIDAAIAKATGKEAEE